MSKRSVLSEQRALWSSNSRDWAAIAEPQNRKLVDEPADDGYAPYALSSPGGLERMLGPAGLRLCDSPS